MALTLLPAPGKGKPVAIGLALMVLLSVLPVGLAQTLASVKHGLWYARSAEFMQQDYLQTLRWLRVIGDTVFAVGVLGYIVLRRVYAGRAVHR